MDVRNQEESGKQFEKDIRSIYGSDEDEDLKKREEEEEEESKKKKKEEK